MKSCRIVPCLAVVALLTATLGAAHARKKAAAAPPKFPGGKVFPSLTNCAQKADTTPFRIDMNVTKTIPGSTWCFGFTVGESVLPEASCGKATVLDKVIIWVLHANRSSITGTRIVDTTGSRAVSGTWTRKGPRGGPYADELSYNKLEWTEAYIVENQPRICLTLSSSVSLDQVCQGMPGQCTIGLYSYGNRGAKCCPVYTVPVP